MKQASWSDSRRLSKCNAGIRLIFWQFRRNNARFRPPARLQPTTGPLAHRIFKTEDTMAKTQKWTASTFVSLVHENLTEKGHKVKKSDLSWAVKDAFEGAVAAGGPGHARRVPPSARP